MWIVTSKVNDYNQHGEYFECAFIERPTEKELKTLGFDAEHLLKGGGRRNGEDVWYLLTEFENGERV